MIEKVIENWHKHLRGEFEGGLDALLADDVVFLSPIVFTPQKGKDLTKLYLNAAGATLGDPKSAAAEGKQDDAAAQSSKTDSKKFHYVKEVMSGRLRVMGWLRSFMTTSNLWNGPCEVPWRQHSPTSFSYSTQPTNALFAA